MKAVVDGKTLRRLKMRHGQKCKGGKCRSGKCVSMA